MRTQPDYPFVTAAIELFADWWKQRRNRTYDLESLVGPGANALPSAAPTASGVRSGE